MGAPLPVLGLRGLWRLSNNFYVNAQVQYFYIEFDPYYWQSRRPQGVDRVAADQSLRSRRRLQRLQIQFRY